MPQPLQEVSAIELRQVLPAFPEPWPHFPVQVQLQQHGEFRPVPVQPLCQRLPVKTVMQHHGFLQGLHQRCQLREFQKPFLDLTHDLKPFP